MTFNPDEAFGDHGPPLSPKSNTDFLGFLNSWEFKLISILPIVIFGTLLNSLFGLQGNFFTWFLFTVFSALLWNRLMKTVREIYMRIQVERAIEEIRKEQEP